MPLGRALAEPPFQAVPTRIYCQMSLRGHTHPPSEWKPLLWSAHTCCQEFDCGTTREYARWTVCFNKQECSLEQNHQRCYVDILFRALLNTLFLEGIYVLVLHPQNFKAVSILGRTRKHPQNHSVNVWTGEGLCPPVLSCQVSVSSSSKKQFAYEERRKWLEVLTFLRNSIFFQSLENKF